jgi:hypothetical protein
MNDGESGVVCYHSEQGLSTTVQLNLLTGHTPHESKPM